MFVIEKEDRRKRVEETQPRDIGRIVQISQFSKSFLIFCQDYLA